MHRFKLQKWQERTLEAQAQKATGEQRAASSIVVTSGPWDGSEWRAAYEQL